jgi:hypothetical protein
MKRRLLLPLFVSASVALVMAGPAAFGQGVQVPIGGPEDSQQFKLKYIVPRMKQTGRLPTIRGEAANNMTIPLWDYTVVSPVDGNTYSGMMVGRNPFFHGHRTTLVQTYLIPVVLTFADSGHVFDPTAPNSCIGGATVENLVLNSPIFANVSYTMNGVNVGNTQYVDAFQRGNFWSNVSITGDSYHTLLSVATLSPVRISVAAGNGITSPPAACGQPFGRMSYEAWDTFVRNTLIPSLAAQGVGPTNLPIFLFDSVFLYIGGNPANCCALGYHDAYGTPLQTYSPLAFDSTGLIGGNTNVMSHEIGEWLNDPTASNPTPGWGHTGQTTGCQNNLEVGDPLSPGFGTPTNPFTVPLPGFTYTLQELAFFSWFYRQTPSIGVGGLYSNNATFTTNAGALCR